MSVIWIFVSRFFARSGGVVDKKSYATNEEHEHNKNIPQYIRAAGHLSAGKHDERDRRQNPLHEDDGRENI